MKVDYTELPLYIDGDILPYRVAFATQTTVYVCEMEGTHSGVLLITRDKRKVNRYLKEMPDLLVSELFFVEDPLQAVMTLKAMLHNMVTSSGCKTFKVVMSGDTNFRLDLQVSKPDGPLWERYEKKGYKANREDSEKPVHWAMLRDWLLDKVYTIVTDNEEADDLLSRACLEGNMIATLDKDLNNTPGMHFNFVKGEKYYVTEDEATHNFWMQCLTGDTADHIPGIKGLGPVKAGRVLEGCTTYSEMEAAVLDVYDNYYPDGALALTEVGCLLWMRREVGEMWEIGR